MTPETTQQEDRARDVRDRRGHAPEALGSLDVWARSAPIRLAGYEDDLAEPHILQGID
ncbi:hypothetical protein [Streptomyces tremellae]|uniref:Uncharacterized protein n=1 Tax=Streptomyces tremellae TaxID=1124239 RepID=A0ABP7GDK5_9ACTN